MGRVTGKYMGVGGWGWRRQNPSPPCPITIPKFNCEFRVINYIYRVRKKIVEPKQTKRLEFRDLK